MGKKGIKYGRESRRMIWKLGGMEGRRKRGMEDGRKGRSIGREEYKVWKNGRKRDMEDRKDGRKEEERDGRPEEGRTRGTVRASCSRSTLP